MDLTVVDPRGGGQRSGYCPWRVHAAASGQVDKRSDCRRAIDNLVALGSKGGRLRLDGVATFLWIGWQKSVEHVESEEFVQHCGKFLRVLRSFVLGYPIWFVDFPLPSLPR